MQYHERHFSEASEQYGTTKTRLGADSIKDWDCCSLSLQPCTDPVCTPHGVLYEREAIYEYILKEKTQIAQMMKKWELEQIKKPAEERSKRKMEEEEAVRKFEETECSILPPTKQQKVDKFKSVGELTDHIKDFDTLGQKKLKDGVMRAKVFCLSRLLSLSHALARSRTLSFSHNLIRTQHITNNILRAGQRAWTQVAAGGCSSVRGIKRLVLLAS